MKITVYKEYNISYPEDMVVCLSDFSTEELEELLKDITNVLHGEIVVLSSRTYISHTDCVLILENSDNDVGIVEISEKEYRCLLNEKSYHEMYELVYHFIIATTNRDMNNTHQWLYDNLNPIEFLLSYNGQW